MKTKLLLSLIALLFVSVLVLLYLNLQKPTPPIVSIPTPTTTPTKSVDLTANWKTYENKEYGFNFKYPQEFTEGDIETYNDKNDLIQLKTSDYLHYDNYEGLGDPFKDGYGLSVALNKDKCETVKKEDSLSGVNNIEQLKVENYSAQKYLFDYEGAYSHHIQIDFNNQCLTINLFPGIETKETSQPLFSQILSTFKFTGPSDLSNHYQLMTENGKSLYLKFPISTTIDKDQIKSGIYTYEISTSIGPGLCPMNGQDTSCSYTDQKGSPWGYYRVWTQDLKPFAINPQVISKDNLNFGGMIITKKTPNTFFSQTELNWWKDILNNKVIAE